VLLDAQFTTPQPGWREQPPALTWTDGTYHLGPQRAGDFIAIAAPVPAPPPDVVVRATFRKTSGPAGGGYGIVLRDQQPDQRDGVTQGGRYYVLAAGDRGEVGIWRREDTQWIDLVPWMPAAAVRSGTAPNTIEAHAVGGTLTLMVNGVQAAQAQDATLTNGGIGVYVGGDGNQVALDTFTVERVQ
jgi:hypothetical protein